MSKMHDIAVIGGGSAGSMAYLRSVLNHDDTLWFVGDAATKRRARSTWVFEVDNIPGMHAKKKPIDGPAKETIVWVKSQPRLADKSTVLKERVVRIARHKTDGFVLTAQKKDVQTQYRARYVILATGVMDVQPDIQGSIAPVFPYANRGDFIYCVRCDGHRVAGTDLAIIGPLATGVALGQLMRERYGVENLAILTHGTAKEAEVDAPQKAERLGFQIYHSPIEAIEGEDELQGFRLEDGTAVTAQKAIIALGSIVYNELATQLGAELAPDGRIIADAKGESSVSGLFVAGDLVSGKKMQIYTGWDEAVDAADAINARLRRSRREKVAA